MSDYPRRKGELVQSGASDGWTVYEPETDSLHVLNASAKAIWELCDGATSPAEMAQAISDLTGLALDQAQSDVLVTLGTLEELRLVEGGIEMP